jgi:hypothetical protein
VFALADTFQNGAKLCFVTLDTTVRGCVCKLNISLISLIDTIELMNSVGGSIEDYSCLFITNTLNRPPFCTPRKR